MRYLLDLKLALRLMLQKPGFAAMTIAIMTIGLGLCIYSYSFIYGMMYKPLPFANGERMHVINTVESGTEYNGGSVSAPDYLAIKESLKGVERIGAYFQSTITLTGDNQSLRRRATYAQADMFEFTQVPPLMGRTFSAEDTAVGANNVAVIGYELWQSYFGGRQDILQQSILVDGVTTAIIGVMPEGYLFPNNINIWLPMQLDLAAMTRKANLGLEVFILRQPGTSLRQINAQLASLMARIEADYPDTNSDVSALAKNYPQSQVGNGGKAITYGMLGAVIFVLALAVTNVANLLLARANERAKETAIRMALGAPRSRLIMQLMWESAAICSIGGLFAILLAGWGLQVTEAFIAYTFSGPLPYFWQFNLDQHATLVALLIVVATTLVTGLIPAWKISSGDFNQILRDGTRGAQSRGANRMGKVLVTLEITLSCALLTVAGVLSLGVVIVNHTDYGVETDNALLARIELPHELYPEQQQQVLFFNQLIAQLNAQPDIAQATLMGNIPGTFTGYTSIAIEGHERSNNTPHPRANATSAMPGALEMLGLAPIAGRLFDKDDNINTPRVAVVTDSFARQQFGSAQEAVGKRFQFAEAQTPVWYQIIGVVPHVIFGQPYAELKYRPAVFTSAQQDTHRYMMVLLKPRAGVDASQLQPVLTQVVTELDINVPAYRFDSYAELIKRNTSGMAFMADIFKLFAIAAVVLAATGIYGVMANIIERRTQEFGVRRALGAPDASVLQLLMKQGLWQLLIGAAIGAPLAFLLGNQMIALLGVTSPWLNLMYLGMPLLIGVVVLYATYVPTRKAIALEPGTALRYE